MSASDSTPAAKPSKPAKPSPDFPLTAHPAGYWCKKIKGKLYYFGPWSDAEGALRRYNEQKEALHAGRTPRPDTSDTTVKDVANAFLAAKQAAVDSGELSPRTWDSYKRTAKVLLAHTGKGRVVSDLRPADFAALRAQMAGQWGPRHLGLMVVCIRAIFKYAYESELIDRPVRYGPTFKGPSKKTIRLHRAAQGPKVFTAEEVRQLIDGAGQSLRAMILLGINCGYGNTDCARLPVTALDLDIGWVDFSRPKTGQPRRCPLWPETVQALREALARRHEPKDPTAAGLAFVTHCGRSWDGGEGASPVTQGTRKLLDRLGIGGHRNFYCLRHTFRTVADGAKDQPAADYIMGHEVAHMSSVYREGIDDARLKAVADHVRAWLFPPV